VEPAEYLAILVIVDRVVGASGAWVSTAKQTPRDRSSIMKETNDDDFG
jgi:hypothetical protein